MSLLDAFINAPIAWLSSIPVVVGLLLNYAELRQARKAEQVRNQLAVVENHRSIWILPFTHPELERVLESEANLTEKPISTRERLFVTFLLLHLKSVLVAQKSDMFIAAKHLDRDIASFFRLPIPNAVFTRAKDLQDPEVVALIERELNRPESAAEVPVK
jgi:hypothetical protein